VSAIASHHADALALVGWYLMMVIEIADDRGCSVLVTASV